MTPPANRSCKAAPNALQASEVTQRNTDRTNLPKAHESTRVQCDRSVDYANMKLAIRGRVTSERNRNSHFFIFFNPTLLYHLSPSITIYHHLSPFLHVRFFVRYWSLNGLRAADPRAFISLTRETLH